MGVELYIGVSGSIMVFIVTIIPIGMCFVSWLSEWVCLEIEQFLNGLQRILDMFTLKIICDQSKVKLFTCSFSLICLFVYLFIVRMINLG